MRVLPLTSEVLQEALAIKHVLNIVEDEYHPKWVGENDIFIISTAKVADATLISDEKRQFRLPDMLAKYIGFPLYVTWKTLMSNAFPLSN